MRDYRRTMSSPKLRYSDGKAISIVGSHNYDSPCTEEVIQRFQDNRTFWGLAVQFEKYKSETSLIAV